MILQILSRIQKTQTVSLLKYRLVKQIKLNETVLHNWTSLDESIEIILDLFKFRF
jgi:hypothetical protein